MIRHFGLFLLAFGMALGLGSAAARAYPTGDPLNTTYTFKVPVNLSDINADKRRAPTETVDVSCAVSENATTNPTAPEGAMGGMGVGKLTVATKNLPVPSNGNLNQTVELSIKGTAYERSYVCWLHFRSHFKGLGALPTALNKHGTSPDGKETDLGHPYDDASLRDVVHGLIN